MITKNGFILNLEHRMTSIEGKIELLGQKIVDHIANEEEDNKEIRSAISDIRQSFRKVNWFLFTVLVGIIIDLLTRLTSITSTVANAIG